MKATKKSKPKVSELQMLWKSNNRKGGTGAQYYDLVSTKYPSNGLTWNRCKLV